ncbi:PA14 domain-containing protein [Paenibacillus sp. SC116]|uniref:PA14 domain-containing protein n=1 Tax=Paenibacillus sp. SC116 TaxID=2968986 RepID=UPI00215B2FDF|nr:PA14 domain-containing protein [Paenibacillus sp. SC116]MCR8845393.1 PA14 domain-containing protein [Paenibacillus sp. SC116]
MKFRKWTAASIVIVLLFTLLPLTASSAATGMPGTPALSQDNWDGDGNYAITMNLHWGQNGTSLEWYENGVLIDTQALTDNSPNHQTATKTFSSKVNGSYIYTAKLINNFGNASSQPITVTVTNSNTTPAPVGNGTGLTGYYYNNVDFSNLKLKRFDSTIQFDWGTNSASPLIEADTFSVRWIGEVQAQFSETYTFTTASSDGVRLWVNNQLLIDQWNDHDTTEHSGTIALTAGQKYTIKLEYYERTTNAVAKLYWSSPSTPKSIIPHTQLYPAPTPDIEVTNFTDNQTIDYPLPLIRGLVSDTNATSVTLTNTSSNRNTKVMQGQVHQGQFKVFADLVPGENNLIIQNGTKQTTLKMTYVPQSNNAVVRIFWYVPSDGNTNYHTFLPNDPQNYAAKLSTYMKVIQSFTAESMNNNGYGRKTFNVELDNTTGKVNVHVLKSNHPISYYYNTTYKGDDLYHEVAGLIPQQYPQAGTKNLTFVGFTKYDAATNYTYANVALGGGDYGVSGGASVWLFPNNETEVQSKFADFSMIDPAFIGEPYTNVQKALSVGYGTALHELGHALGLPHEGGPNSIMWRGFDWLHRFFVLKDGNGYVFNDNELPVWDPISALTLSNSAFFNASQQPRGIAVGGTVTVSNTNSPVGQTKESAFDHNEASKWLVFDSTASIQYQFQGTNAHAVQSYAITSAEDVPERDPRNWTLSGSNDGTTWTALDTRSNELFTSRHQTKTYNISNTTAYRYYKFSLVNNSGGILQLAEIRLYE